MSNGRILLDKRFFGSSKIMKIFLFTLLLTIALLFQYALAAEIRLAWSPNQEQDLAGYKVYYGTASGVYNGPGSPINVGNVTSYRLLDLSPGQTYFIALKAYDTLGNESGYSNEVSGISRATRLDLDGDAFSDLAGLTSAGTVFYTTDLQTLAQIPGALEQIVSGDFDGDAFSDLAGLTSDGSIFYTTNRWSWTQIPGYLAQLVVGDFNGDGQSELAGLASDGKIFYTTNLQTWTQIPGYLAQLVVGDFDGDGLSDLAGLNSVGTIFYTTDLQTWTQIPGNLTQLVVGYFDEDDLSDLAGLASDGSIFYTTNRSNWTQIPGMLSELAE